MRWPPSLALSACLEAVYAKARTTMSVLRGVWRRNDCHTFCGCDAAACTRREARDERVQARHALGRSSLDMPRSLQNGMSS